MPSYIELSKNASLPSASSDAYVVLGINTSGQITITNNSGQSSLPSASYALTASYALNGESTNTSSLLVTASVSSNVITFTKGDATTFDITVDTGSAVATVDTGSFATTGSNTFVGEQTISGSIQISGSIIPATDGVSTTSSFSLGSATNAWKDIWVSNGTINFLDGAGNVQAALSSTDQGLQIQNYPADTGSVPVFNVSGSGTFTDGLTVTGSVNIGNSLVQSVPTSSGDGLGASTLQLKPDRTLGSDQYIVLDPTSPNHIHIRAGGAIDASSAYLYLGGENNNVLVNDGGQRVEIKSVNPVFIDGSLEQGTGVLATGSYSHAEGYFTIASGSYSHAEGGNTVVLGQYSHAEGFHTIASGSGQHVTGQFNEHNNLVSYFIVGIGSDNNNRKDGFTVDVDANGSGSVMIPHNLDAPSVAKTGSMYVDPANNKLWIYTGNGGVGGWVTASLG